MLYLKNTILFVLLSALLMAPMASAQDIVIIANPDVSLDSITPSDIKKIFLGKKADWGNGSKITFFTAGQRETHETLLKKFVKKTPSQYRIFWKKQAFTGKGKIPRSSGNDQEMVDLVISTKGAIGYVSAGVDLGRAKTLSIQ